MERKHVPLTVPMPTYALTIMPKAQSRGGGLAEVSEQVIRVAR